MGETGLLSEQYIHIQFRLREQILVMRKLGARLFELRLRLRHVEAGGTARIETLLSDIDRMLVGIDGVVSNVELLLVLADIDISACNFSEHGNAHHIA